MKGKFKVGDKVVISPKYRNKYNCLTTVGTVTNVGFNGIRCTYNVKFENKKFEKYFYSYELELAPKEKIEIPKEGDTPKNKPIVEVNFRPQDVQQEKQEPKFKIGDSVFLTSQAIQWLKDNDHSHNIDPTDYYKPLEITQSFILPYDSKGEKRTYYRLNNKYGIIFFAEDLIPALSENKCTQKDSTLANNPYLLSTLKNNWIKICNSYLVEFCKRHEFSYDEDMWISGNPGTTAEVCDMIISMEDIRYDVDNQIDPDLFQKWYYKSLDVYELTNGTQKYLNYPSFCKGAPDPFTNERIEQLRKAHQRVQEAEEALKLEIETFKNNKKLF